MVNLMSNATVAAWEDDPFAGIPENQPDINRPVHTPVPDFDPPGLPIGISGTQPDPEIYDVGTDEFRYWALAEALARAAGYWSRVVPAGTGWQRDNGPRLIAVPDEGVDLNAYYDRGGLHFFHDTVRGTTVYSADSPDVVSHELGHAVLDAVKPELWNAASIEVSAFHESFGDCSAILSNLQSASLRKDVLAETGGRVETASRLSRLAENLGWALRQLVPDSVTFDCLRSAVNSFYYQAPATLPPQAPATSLSSDPHNFSRVFTAGFLRTLGGVFRAQQNRDPASLLKAAEDAGKLLIEGVRRASVAPGFYAQVAAQMVAADAEIFKGRYRSAIRAGFISTGVLSVRSAASLDSERRLATTAALIEPDGGEPAPVPLSGAQFGLPGDLWVRAASQPRRYGVASGLPDAGDTPVSAPEEAAVFFVEDLIRRGRIEPGHQEVGEAPIMAARYTTHELQLEGEALELRRTKFACGFEPQ